MSTPADIGKPKKSNKITPPPKDATVSSATIPKAPSLVQPTTASTANVPSPEELQAQVQDKVNDRIAKALVDSVAIEKESAFDANFVHDLYTESLADVANGPKETRFTLPEERAPPKKKAAPAAMPPKETAPANTNSLVEKYVRYYNTRRAAHPQLRWQKPEDFARMREADQQLLYREIYVAENSKAINVPVLSRVLVETAKYISAMSVIANANGLLSDEHTIGIDSDTRESFYTIIDKMVKKGEFDDDLAQFWCEYAEYFQNTGPVWRLTMKTLGALGGAIQPTTANQKLSMPTMPRSNLPEATAKKAADKFAAL